MNVNILHDTSFWLGVFAGWAALVVGWLFLFGCLLVFHNAHLTIRLYTLHRRIRRRMMEDQHAQEARSRLVASGSLPVRRLELLKGSRQEGRSADRA
jgi:hypothetical protein